jgi:hypothetical protein
MPDAKVSNLVAATTPTGVDLLYLVQSATSKKATFAQALLRPVTLITFSNTPYAVAIGDWAILVDASGGAVTVNLPALLANRVLNIKKTDSSKNNVTVSNGTIDGASSASLTKQYANVTLICDGTNWNII